MDTAYDTNLGIHNPSNRWSGCRGRGSHVTPLPVKSDHNHKIPVAKLLQDVVLLVLCLLHIRSDDPHANQLEGGCLVTTTDRGALMKVTE